VNREDGFLDAVHRLGCECASFGGGRLKVVLPENLEVRELYRLAAEHTVQIRRMNYRRDSLEDIFLKAMEGKSAMTKGSANGRL
jgi:ABC-2 type transport system ATP-binding protein